MAATIFFRRVCFVSAPMLAGMATAHSLIRRALHVVCVTLLATVISAPLADAGTVYGFGFPYGPVYRIDAATGNTVVAAPKSVFAFGATISSTAGRFFITTGINLWTEDLAGNATPRGGLLAGAVDLAFDSDRNVLYGLSDNLYHIDAACPGFDCFATLIAPLPAGIMGIDFIRGAGLYGISNFDRLLYRIDPLTGQAVPAALTTGIPVTDGIMDLAYDAATDAFVVSVMPGQLVKSIPPSPVANLYRINRSTGAANLLSSGSPAMLGLAENVPEPSTGALLVCAVTMLLLIRRYSVNRGT